MSIQNNDFHVYEALKKHNFDPDDIASLARYIDEQQQKSMKSILDQVDAKFETFRADLVTKKQAWQLVAVVVILNALVPDGFQKVIELLQALP